MIPVYVAKSKAFTAEKERAETYRAEVKYYQSLR